MFLMFMARTAPAKQEPLLEWLANHQQEIRDGGATYNGQRITADTKLVRYASVYSFLVYTHRQRSSFMLADDGNSFKTALLSSLLTAIFGWWSLYGIFYTPAALAVNLTGGQTKTVDKFFEDLKYGKLSEPFDMRPFWGIIMAVPALYFLLMIGLGINRCISG